jgi:hypothetical protein
VLIHFVRFLPMKESLMCLKISMPSVKLRQNRNKIRLVDIVDLVDGSRSSQDKVGIDDPQKLDGVWLNSKSGSRAFSSIVVNACPPISVFVEGCERQNAIFINGSYRVQSAWYGSGYLLLIYRGNSFSTILSCLVRKKADVVLHFGTDR